MNLWNTFTQLSGAIRSRAKKLSTSINRLHAALLDERGRSRVSFSPSNGSGKTEQQAETLLRFLFDHIERSLDFQARVKWEPGTVVLWDNRITAHVRMGLIVCGTSIDPCYGASLRSWTMEHLKNAVTEFVSPRKLSALSQRTMV